MIIPYFYLKKLHYWTGLKPEVDSIHNLTLYLKEAPFNFFANKADPDQAALIRAA